MVNHDKCNSGRKIWNNLKWEDGKGKEDIPKIYFQIYYKENCVMGPVRLCENKWPQMCAQGMLGQKDKRSKIEQWI